jgi:hypothetical protein
VLVTVADRVTSLVAEAPQAAPAPITIKAKIVNIMVLHFMFLSSQM